MLVLDAAATDRALGVAELADALRSMLARRAEGRTDAPERLALALPGGTLLVMPASDGQYASTKLVTVHADNAARGLPSLQGEVVLMRADTGERLLLLDGPTLTARRTAAMSLLAMQQLAPQCAGGPMLLIGAGVQGRSHLEAFAAAGELATVHIASRSRGSAERLVAHAATLGLDARVADDAQAQLACARIVLTATTASGALFADEVRDDAFVAAVGAYRPQMCELPARLLHRARVYVDDIEGARHEAGDLIQAQIDWSAVTPLERVVSGAAAAPGPGDGPIVFKSVGQALWDLAAARLAWESLCPAD
ncbi:MAG: delta(1)-pyrroline-2-carboxylate reductase family protein [Burkholderiaceae bacterium]|nr:delta(1)-pyrroline-2-carboxylate reductase family protein [Burkholderiaceae bacterium]